MRTVGSNAEQTSKAIKEAAIKLIAKQGYQAVSLRMLAQEIGIQAGSLYNHMDNKQELLGRILCEIMEELLEIMQNALQGLDDPRARLRTFIRVHVEYHTVRKDEVFIGQMELRNLTPENFERLITLRDTYERLLTDVLQRGQATCLFVIDDLRLTRFAIIAMLSDIASWYKSNGRFDEVALTRHYTLMIERLLGMQDPGAGL